jgi:uncharacterized protein YndB with AHSA1/START domain
MRKEKIHIEYPLNRASKASLWSTLSTPAGMAGWFADQVVDNGKTFTFTWNKHAVEAQLLTISPLSHIRFHWMDEEDDTYFEFRMHKIELTGEWMLEITDFVETDEKQNAITLWDTQVKSLRRRLGL